ncbi:hypothetical protein AA0229_2717 [Gluconobacter cerinus NRIC 0229]|nr:hypothetical protein AA0229_2717 [Gluconobacter cerinus NRIC 0229]
MCQKLFSECQVRRLIDIYGGLTVRKRHETYFRPRQNFDPTTQSGGIQAACQGPKKCSESKCSSHFQGPLAVLLKPLPQFDYFRSLRRAHPEKITSGKAHICEANIGSLRGRDVSLYSFPKSDAHGKITSSRFTKKF